MVNKESKRFKVSLKNRQVRRKLVIMAPAILVAVLITLFYELQFISLLIVMLGAVLFYTWRFRFNRKNR
ncbi:hypothetical protein [Psychrobacillus sp. FJAT-21963]|uniref:hypothetical protein n=1 Tax=Psychrobacillus sp. FJAT-21963 TaxID=1712028 RepID=UPI0006FF2E2D|nr:hypothetical protein [Psychrobacillus sp. FJAT-21963]KQL27365.1 hypothetical protein AN959_20290 [Psychrobacillus sp. FJAT-21963]